MATKHRTTTQKARNLSPLYRAADAAYAARIARNGAGETASVARLPEISIQFRVRPDERDSNPELALFLAKELLDIEHDLDLLHENVNHAATLVSAARQLLASATNRITTTKWPEHRAVAQAEREQLETPGGAS